MVKNFFLTGVAPRCYIVVMRKKVPPNLNGGIMFFETADMHTRNTYGITLPERIALIPMRAVVAFMRLAYGQSCMEA